MTIYEAEKKLAESLSSIYNARESAAIADQVMEHLMGMKKIDRIIRKKTGLAPELNGRYEKYSRELLLQRPMQYVLGESWFCGRKFLVEEHVLIPRPETEELVQWILKDEHSQPRQKARILDIGTGSGIIPITLDKEGWPGEIWACDISGAALDIAKKNAGLHGASIHFLQLDFLNQLEWKNLPAFDLLVCNPPYIPKSDAGLLDFHVSGFEPHLALFVPDEEPLIFYEALAKFGAAKLASNGLIYAELHEPFAIQVEEIFRKYNYPGIELKKDMQGKTRMIKVIF